MNRYVVFEERGMVFHWSDDENAEREFIEINYRASAWTPHHQAMAEHLADCSREAVASVGGQERRALMRQLEDARRMSAQFGAWVLTLTRERDDLRRRLRKVIAAGKAYRAEARRKGKRK